MIERLENLLDAGIKTMSEMHACQRRMHEWVLLRDWVALQKESAVRDSLERKMTAIETERQTVMAAIAPEAAAVTDFYRVTSLLESGTRGVLNAKFRELKRLVMLSKTENEIFETYLNHAQSLLKGLIDAVMPSRRNRIYTKNGGFDSGPVESLVLNRSF